MRGMILVAMLAMAMATSAFAGDGGLLDVGARAQVSANGSFIYFSPTGGDFNYRGADLGGAVTYSLGDAFAVFGAYDHAFPFKDSDGHFNFARLMASLKLYPNQGSGPSSNAVFVAVGRGWFGRSDIRTWQTNEAQVVVAHQLQPRLAAFASYSHSFATESDQESDLDFVKVGLNGRIFP